VGAIRQRINGLLPGTTCCWSFYLSATRARLMERWKWFQENGGISKTRFDPQFDYLESKPYDYLKTIIYGLRISTGENLSTGESYEVARPETILRKNARPAPQPACRPATGIRCSRSNERLIESILYRIQEKHPKWGIIRDFNPDCGIRNLKAAIEFKYEPDTAVTLLLGATQTSMKGSTDGNGCWYCEVPNGIDFTSADAIWQLFSN